MHLLHPVFISPLNCPLVHCNVSKAFIIGNLDVHYYHHYYHESSPERKKAKPEIKFKVEWREKSPFAWSLIQSVFRDDKVYICECEYNNYIIKSTEKDFQNYKNPWWGGEKMLKAKSLFLQRWWLFNR